MSLEKTQALTSVELASAEPDSTFDDTAHLIRSRMESSVSSCSAPNTEPLELVQSWSMWCRLPGRMVSTSSRPRPTASRVVVK